jgi:hypothetical protein
LFHESAPPLRLGLGAGSPGPTCADDGRYYFVRPGYFALAFQEKLIDGQTSSGVAPLSLALLVKLNLTANSCIALSSSRNAVSFSSARTFSHSPESNPAFCASASVMAQDDSYTRVARYRVPPYLSFPPADKKR